MSKLFAAIDQGTTSSRFIVFDERLLRVVAVHQIEHAQLTPHPGWLSHSAAEIFENVTKCVAAVCETLGPERVAQIASVGITNQRETTVAWSRRSGRPLADAIVWSDARTHDIVERFVATHGNGSADFARRRCGLPCSTYFSAMKMRWMLENEPDVARAAATGDLMIGTIDAWLIYKLTAGEVFATDVTNASRTMLMNITTRMWDADLCALFGVPRAALPKILPSASCDFGKIAAAAAPELGGVAIGGCVGDQQGALVGQLCLGKGQLKNTFGTGCFLLANVGCASPVFSNSGLLTTVAFQLGADQPCFYALEGAVAGAGSAVQWLRDKMKMVRSAKESEKVAASVPDAGGVAFVPAFGGLLAPHWCPAARGTIVGMTQQTRRAHIVRATLEAVVQQVASLVDCVEKDLSGGSDAVLSESTTTRVVQSLKVDGGMAANSLLLQLQADALGVPVLRPRMLETTAKGAALCAAVGAGHLSPAGLERLQQEGFARIAPKAPVAARAAAKKRWERAVRTAIAYSKL